MTCTACNARCMRPGRRAPIDHSPAVSAARLAHEGRASGCAKPRVRSDKETRTCFTVKSVLESLSYDYLS